MSTTAIRQAERDALAYLGLLAHAHERFDVPVAFPNESAPSHVFGLNIHAMIVDNTDGEVLALDRNAIHRDGSPLSHGEQRALHAAIGRISQKRPRQPAQSIEGYYRSSMFLARGTTPEDFLNLGATLYSTLEPCPFCAAALLVSRMKRVCFVLADKKYGGAWQKVKTDYYAGDDTTYLQLSMGGTTSAFATAVADLHAKLVGKTDPLRTAGTRDTHLLDFCRPELHVAFDLLMAAKPGDLASVTAGDTRNANTLAQLQRMLSMPVAS
jgi:tRNA(Arg) A34 adenosine deaminase TadA